MTGTAFDRDLYEEKLHDPTALPIPLPFEFLKDITSNFSNEQELGRGGYGVVFKGVLHRGKIIAVKKLLDHLVDHNQFEKEITNLIGIRHQNIVQLVGYCAESRSEATELPNGSYVLAERRRSLLCFEYLGNKGLDKHVSDESSGLDWNKRYEIIKGICSGLHFLHEKCNIVHLDLKPENILMDDAMMPKIADFGLARLLGAQKSRTIISGNLAGTCGYMAPEYQLQGVVSPKADIFSFGVIIIEIITGAKEYPMGIEQYLQQFNENHSRQSTETSLKKYREDVIGRWRNVFKRAPKCTSPEICIEQVQQCITTAFECLDFDSTRRPTACDISQMLTGEMCSCQKKTLLSAQPFELRFNFTPVHVVRSSSLHLTNNTDDAVAFRMMTNDRDEYFPSPVHGLVPPRSRYPLPVAMSLPPEDDNRFTIELQCTIVGDQGAGSADDTNHFFTEAKNQGREIQHVKLLVVIEHDEAGFQTISRSRYYYGPYICLLPLSHSYGSRICVHPTKTWIMTFNMYEPKMFEPKKVFVWDYGTQETVHHSEFHDLDEVCVAIFVPRKQWFLAGWGKGDGYITVYNYETTQKVKTFRAHDHDIQSLDIHPSEPYVLSASFGHEVKLWNWEKGWECIRTIDICHDVVEVKLNPKDADYFACITRPHCTLEIWNVASASCVYHISDTDFFSLDYFTCGNELRLITGASLTCGNTLRLITGASLGVVKIWDWQSRECLETFEYNDKIVTTVYAHPDLPILITGSSDGIVCLWNSITFELEGKLNVGRGPILAVVCLKGSNRIAIGQLQGLTIAEI